MQKITTVVQLREAILLLKIIHAEDELLLRKQCLLAQESLKPASLIKSAFKDITSAPASKINVGDTAIGMTAGYLAKKVLSIASGNPLVKLLGIVLQVGVANFVTKHPSAIKSTGRHVLKRIFAMRKNGTITSP